MNNEDLLIATCLYSLAGHVWSTNDARYDVPFRTVWYACKADRTTGNVFNASDTTNFRIGDTVIYTPKAPVPSSVSNAKHYTTYDYSRAYGPNRIPVIGTYSQYANHFFTDRSWFILNERAASLPVNRCDGLIWNAAASWRKGWMHWIRAQRLIFNCISGVTHSANPDRWRNQQKWIYPEPGISIAEQSV